MRDQVGNAECLRELTIGQDKPCPAETIREMNRPEQWFLVTFLF